jgi:hypothetical protein
VHEGNPALRRLPAGMRAELEQTLESGEEILELWSTRGIGANALVCTPTRALISKRSNLIRWMVGTFPYSELTGARVLDGRPGATQVELVGPEPSQPRPPTAFDDFPDAYYQVSVRLLAANTVMFRSRRRAREAATVLEDLIAEHRR